MVQKRNKYSLQNSIIGPICGIWLMGLLSVDVQVICPTDVLAFSLKQPPSSICIIVFKFRILLIRSGGKKGVHGCDLKEINPKSL